MDPITLGLTAGGAAAGSSLAPAVAGILGPGLPPALLGSGAIGGIPLTNILGAAGGAAGAGLGSLISPGGPGSVGNQVAPPSPPGLVQGAPPQPRASLRGDQLLVRRPQQSAQVGGLPLTLEELLRRRAF